MADKRSARPVSAWRLFWFGVAAGFLLDVVGHTISVFLAGYPVTLANIYAHGTRALHAEAWIFSGALCIAIGAFVVGQIVGAILGGRKEQDNA